MRKNVGYKPKGGCRSKYGHRTVNWFEAIINKLGGEEAAERFLRDELVVSEPAHRWQEKDGVIYFSVTSDGTTGEDWITRLEHKGFRVGDYAKQVLRSSDFRPTSGVVYRVAVLKGMLFADKDRNTKNIRFEAYRRKFSKPNAELACLIRETFSCDDLEAMGLWWIVPMHEPIKDSGGDSRLLNVDRNDDGRWLGVSDGSPDNRWDRDGGFAFVVSQVVGS